MKFLVVTKNKMPIPPEMALGLVEAMEGWIQKYTDTGKMDQVWGFAGLQGGGGILNVSSLEELDSIMTEFPFGPFSNIEVYGLADLDLGLQKMKELIKAMPPQNM
jgi:muconolactone delta-isomerase